MTATRIRTSIDPHHKSHSSLGRCSVHRCLQDKASTPTGPLQRRTDPPHNSCTTLPPLLNTDQERRLRSLTFRLQVDKCQGDSSNMQKHWTLPRIDHWRRVSMHSLMRTSNFLAYKFLRSTTDQSFHNIYPPDSSRMSSDLLMLDRFLLSSSSKTSMR